MLDEYSDEVYDAWVLLGKAMKPRDYLSGFAPTGRLPDYERELRQYLVNAANAPLRYHYRQHVPAPFSGAPSLLGALIASTF